MKRILASVLVLSLFSMGFVGCSGDKKPAPKTTPAPANEPAKDKK